MRAYHPDLKRPRGAYLVPASPVPAQRPNRTAAGMTATYERKKRRTTHKSILHLDQTHLDLSRDALGLAVRGTLDPLSHIRSDLERVKCPCCDSFTNKVRLRPGAAKTRRLMIARLKRLRLVKK